ncbi:MULTISPECIES: hypothetical protein [unclassified Streptomyces]|uniref:hypothetical protein n=1 Tax=unclassified Streptomyces TaxID=2593676 RepID=UPI0006AD874A|nr:MULTISPECIES: hypothetical protein [unclassified Streptomyces]KOX26927.1 hypothetical protein ADL06_14945 [Streptomyces sp. NRRL F-6491]KOX44862.1 hypothetical protein ADL08_14095 [Streptomyces sp. NRRL F-6492]
MRIEKGCLAAGVVAALLAGAGACTSDGGEPVARTAPTAGPACGNGTCVWFDVDRRDVLTGVAEKQTLGKGGGSLTHELTPLHTPRVAVAFEKGPRIDAKAVLHSPGVRAGDAGDAGDTAGADAFTDVRRTAPDPRRDDTAVDGAGTFVNCSWVKQVVADFRYTCGNGERTTGRATSWVVDGSGILECSEPVERAKEGDPVVAAARLARGPDAPAAGPGGGRPSRPAS